MGGGGGGRKGGGGMWDEEDEANNDNQKKRKKKRKKHLHFNLEAEGGLYFFQSGFFLCLCLLSLALALAFISEFGILGFILFCIPFNSISV